jgi:hypothetical protein
MKGEIIQVPTYNLNYTVKPKKLPSPCHARQALQEKRELVTWGGLQHEEPQLRSTYKIMSISTIPFSLN